jgi:putative ABC transport system permease protein
MTPDPSSLSAQRSALSAVFYAFRRLRRGWRSGELLILSLAIAVAVAAAGAVSLFTERVRAAIAAQAGDVLGADLVVIGRDALPPEFVGQLRDTGAKLTRTTSLPSVVFNGDASTLAAVKAVEPGYPLRGALRVAPEPFGPEQAVSGPPPQGEAWVDQRLWSELHLAPGTKITVGALELRATRVLAYEPDRGGGLFDFAPRLLLNSLDLPATQLVQKESRLQNAVLLGGAPDALARVRALKVPAGFRRLSPEDARPELKTALDRAGQFLDLAVLAATLLAAAAVALCAHAQGQRLRDEVALLKCLGARTGYITVALLASLLAAGVVAGLAGALVGYVAQAVIAKAVGGLLQVTLPPPAVLPLGSALLLGLLMLLGFGAPAVLDARRVPPIRVFQRDFGARGLSWLVPAGAVAGIVALLWLQAGQFKLAAYVLAGAAITTLALGLLAWGLVMLLAPLKRSVGTAWRFGLGNVARRRLGSVAQAVALGQALLALLMLTVARGDLLATWKDRLKPGTPNQFLINVQADQVEPLRKFFAERGQPDLKILPMARGRLTALNGKAVTTDSFDDPETKRWINREFNLSWTDRLLDDNRVAEGRWWTPADRGKPLISADRYAVERLHLKLGDRMTLALGDREIEFTVTSFREVDWNSFRPNFFLLVPPGAVDGASASWLSSFYLPPGSRSFARELVKAFPNITVLDVGALMNQVRAIMDRVVNAVEFIMLFTLAAGLTVLLAAIEGTRDERIRETGLLRALGARTPVIVKGLVAEYAVLGLLAGSVAAIAAQVVTWVLAEQVFKIPYGPRPELWLAGALAGMALVTALGWLSLRGTLKTPPHQVLRATA